LFFFAPVGVGIMRSWCSKGCKNQRENMLFQEIK
jgi:hypothetical protein